ncbi:MAG: Ribonuclease HI [Chloroflexi bacterium]|nr:MAG: Ribonuclease HI [Chloroflexota bacterium]
MPTQPTCDTCGDPFAVPDAQAQRFPGWTPKQCPACFRKKSPAKSRSKSSRPGKPRTGSASLEADLTTAEVLARYTDGPTTGLFTDGACTGNPGPGGWGAVYVLDGEVIEQRHGHDPDTTNNRMELQAVIEAIHMAPSGRPLTLYSDSQLVVNTLTQWAAAWEKRGWRRKQGPVENLDLVQPAYALARANPDIAITWLRGHSGSRWNEYADALATAFRRPTL